MTRKPILVVFLMSLAASGAIQAGDSFHLDQSARIAITESGEDGVRSKTCVAFKLTEADVRAFFATAMAITRQEERENFDHSSCFVRGTATVGAETYHWEIRASGTAAVTLRNGAVMVLGNPENRHPHR
jgi:hypothetical protein